MRYYVQYLHTELLGGREIQTACNCTSRIKLIDINSLNSIRAEQVITCRASMS